ncbi:MAG: DUF1800 domain-containing protein [Myxococcaceae bacterium]|nr:DUF1800 domain-containing protein [Myxococcaceae bacterium]
MLAAVITVCAAVAPLEIPANGWDRAKQAQHLLSRAAFGPSAADRARVEELSVGGWLAEQLEPGRDDALEERIAADFPTLKLSVTEALVQFPKPVKGEEMRNEERPRQLVVELTQAKLLRAVKSRRQLEEVLVDFWFNHFNVSAEKNKVRWLVSPYERDAIRPFVLGRFRDLLGATARHPAMLVYLDNWMSVRDGLEVKALRRAMGLNENYARELLELHTLGVDAGYTQADVRAAARALTGWSLELKKRDDAWGGFLYRPRAHDTAEKNVFGLELAAGGQQDDGERLLDYLALHPKTARHLCFKLAQKFVSDAPPAELVDALAAEYLRTGGDLRAVYVLLFGSRAFWADEAFAAKTKTPLELVVSSVRAVGDLTTVQPQLVKAIDAMGQPLYRASPPTGFSELAPAWVSAGALVSRINFGLKLGKNEVPGVQVPLASLPEGEPELVVDALALRLLGAPLTEASRQTVLSQRDPRVIVGLLMGSPEFQKQ